jgi:hypothetical protein
MITDDELDKRISNADRARDIEVDGVVLGALLSDARRAARSDRRGRRILAAIAGTFVVIAAGVGIPATASMIERFTAQTGVVPTAEPRGDGGTSQQETESIPGSEWIDLSASDLRPYLDSVFPSSIPLAPGQSRAELIDAFVSTSATGAENAAVRQNVGIVHHFENAIYVGWVSEWIAAYRAGDHERQDRAAEVISSAQTWEGYSVVYAGQGLRMMTDWAERIRNGDYESAQALAQFEHAAAWDGSDRQPIIAQVVDGARE